MGGARFSGPTVSRAPRRVPIERAEESHGSTPAPLNRTALIVGISGQDGAYLARLLVEKGYRVVGASRDSQLNPFTALQTLNVRHCVELVTVAPSDFRSVVTALQRVNPDEIYYLAGQSSPGLSFDQPVETFESITLAVLNFLEAIRFSKLDCKFYHACSSEIFGETQTPATETTTLNPSSPYAVAKAAAYWQVRLYREAYAMRVCSGILFNHESPLRPERFVTMKIARAVAEIVLGRQRELVLGNLDISRDWGWAPEYVEAMWRIMQLDEPEDFVIATGHAYSLREFLAAAFAAASLDWQAHVRSDSKLFRPSDPRVIVGDPSKAARMLKWRATLQAPDVAQRLVEAALQRVQPRAARESVLA
ncbi:MAG TPA: GDP-mannose 4,6-dehydratase [Candidatus Acidoferrum sp.]|nr:GDP-mannose 4,6-dehydratase [Candidatus Acidoferrum sp.]